MEIVHAWGGNEAMKVTMYRIDDSGYRDSQPLATLTYKRQKAEDSSAKSAGQSGWSAYMTLGDLLSQYGYDSMIGQWRGHNDEANVDIDVQYKWALAKHAILVDATSGQFEYRGMITLAPSGEEVVQFGADNMGGTWKSTWTEGYDGVTNRHEMRRPDGTTQKMEHVYSKLEKDSFKLTEYGVESSGYRASSRAGRRRSSVVRLRRRRSNRTSGMYIEGPASRRSPGPFLCMARCLVVLVRSGSGRPTCRSDR